MNLLKGCAAQTTGVTQMSCISPEVENNADKTRIRLY